MLFGFGKELSFVERECAGFEAICAWQIYFTLWGTSAENPLVVL